MLLSTKLQRLLGRVSTPSGVTVAMLALSSLLAAPRAHSQETVDFQKDVRPILSDHCFKCHGPDENTREAKLRLDIRDEALQNDPENPAIVPGKPEESELIRRIFAQSPDDLMPPPEAKIPLSSQEKEILSQWIAAGAEYKPHWAFIPPQRPALPKVKQAAWPKNEIDHFVLARLEKEGLEPSPEADRYTLARRLHLDLIGLPPAPEEVSRFVNDPSPNAYEALVDYLLASPQYGERWARRWLDIARYADTNGYEKDRPRSIWLYRDWVINALNRDMPFDQFTIEQIAGDMLPQATLQQRIATGFHRNTMINEEGGIDPLEFRFHAMTDRVATTGSAWLGLTIGCAQCHTHKYDPISHREYYQFMAFMDDADEPELAIPDARIAGKRAATEAKIKQLITELPNRFPVPDFQWRTISPSSVTTASAQKAELLEDGSFRLLEPSPERDTYTAIYQTDLQSIENLRLEILADPELPKNGPGRAQHGNFVLSELRISAAPRDAPDDLQDLELSSPTADFSQDGFPIANVLDGNPKTGWAIHGPGNWNVSRAAEFRVANPFTSPSGLRLIVRIDQQHGDHHTLGRVRISAGEPLDDDRPIEVRRRELIEKSFNVWLEKQRRKTVPWTVLKPVEAKANLPLLTILEDDSIFATGDQTKSDTYHLKFATEGLSKITAIRLDAIPDERLPKNGPGRVYYEGPIGDFTLSELKVRSGAEPLSIKSATHSYANGGFTASAAIDGNPQTGWSIDGAQGRAHHAIFRFEQPLAPSDLLEVEMLFERHFSAGLGRFKVSATSAMTDRFEARDFPPYIEELLLKEDSELTSVHRQELLNQFLLDAPELAEARAEIDKLRNSMPQFPTTLVMQERPPENPRTTFIRHRGEFLQPTDPVEPAVPAILHPLPDEAPRNRLTFAKWLVASENPLVARVTVNRQWSAFFGQGLVRTEQDFGLQGELPSHPELLDWLAIEFMDRGWSLKQLHKLIVMSATYQQASNVSHDLLQRDPSNQLLARGPRVRLEAELIRDTALQVAGLLTKKIGGPSVFPPQPGNITTEGTYGKLDWNVSEGADRYRRGLYTFSKRTAPYAVFATFDAPSGEACLVKRERSNSPLQALTLLNDTAFFEAARALGNATAEQPGSVEERAEQLFQKFLCRKPTAKELDLVVQFFDAQRTRFQQNEADPIPIAGANGPKANERAAWTLLARALLNLDETITKN